MKGRKLQAQRPATLNRAAIFCALFIATRLTTPQCGFAGESTNILRRNSIIVPAESISNKNLLVINPSATNSVPNDKPIVGPTNITELEEVLQLYADLRGRTVLWPRDLSVRKPDFVTDKPLTRQQATTALDAFFGLNGIALVDVGDTWVKAVSMAGCQTSADSTGQTNYLTDVQHLTYVKPTDLVAVLQPFSSGIANSILPIDSQQMLVLRDLPENIQRMRKAIREVDVAAPIECTSEVIPLKYAKASEIAAAVAGRRSRLQSAVKVLADERTNSLLVYAGKEDMKRIKEIVSTLDIVAAQILVKAVIIEVDRSKNSKLSVIDDDHLSWMTNFVQSAPPVAEPRPANEVADKSGFRRFAAITNDLDSVVSTLATNPSVRILQNPQIQTSDGEPAQLFVGESQPYPDGAYTCGSSIQMINQGVTLELTPTITNNGLVALAIHQIIEQPNGSVTIANVGDVPITRRTERSAKLVVRDGDVLLLDGSVEKDDAPAHPQKAKSILGGLFHHSKPATNQNELIVLIRPKILPMPEVATTSRN
jgi:type II secretory pathway component GspD/PulD (secretin)